MAAVIPAVACFRLQLLTSPPDGNIVVSGFYRLIDHFRRSEKGQRK
ncbi:MAG: hypothetical protein IJJ42_06055 [Clostridia bacterium]|nr:hypothetical protein [Clostridia bacterium]